MPTQEPRDAFSALLVPVAEADWLVRDRHRAMEPPSPVAVARSRRVPAHVTLLCPFAEREALTEGMISELAHLFADVVPFRFSLDEVCEFPSGVVYLAPEPATPFRQLTSVLARRFPEYPPYEGQFSDVVPHLTVPLLDGETAADVQRLVTEHGPLTAYATEVHLVWVAGDSVDLVAALPFGSTAA